MPETLTRAAEPCGSAASSAGMEDAGRPRGRTAAGIRRSMDVVRVLERMVV